ncbi:hypothetical protein CLPUN_06100 [Clostridium puniceum]|uniref:BCR, YitT family n=1 Tax=Clostridium puniceum TaxID=29367 RepID=A0A1S8TWH5_9CLOT|nr:hypothetical protein [Clostridium puniceum]OOM82114.1 hypothetical protein CLPUN_06100 [Clostridium puniceum]
MNNTINKLNQKLWENFFIKVLVALIAVALVGFGLAFNSSAMLGNDPIAVFYDGVRNLFGFPRESLGMINNSINYTIVGIMFIFGRQYLNIGTFIYTLPMGSFINIGFKIYELIGIPTTLNGRIVTAFCGCLMLYLGIGIFIAINIGMDPCTGIVMMMKDRIKHEYKVSKVICDVCMLSLGFAFGGKIGVVTVISALIGGPTIQKVSEIFEKKVIKPIKLSEIVVNNN